MAAGMTVQRELFKFLQAFLGKELSKNKFVQVNRLEIDGVIHLSYVNFDTIRVLHQLGPFGSGNPEPLFILVNVRVKHSSVVNDRHVRCLIVGERGAPLRAFAFRSKDSNVGHALLAHHGSLMHIAGILRRYLWRFRDNILFIIEDYAYA